MALLAWASASGASIVEDDYDGEYRYGGRSVTAVQGLDGGGRVIYVGTFTKMLFPSLRLAYVVVPDGLAEPFVRARRLQDGHPPALAQAVAADFLADGHLAAHLRRMRALYAERRNTLAEAVRAELGGAASSRGSRRGSTRCCASAAPTIAPWPAERLRSASTRSRCRRSTPARGRRTGSSSATRVCAPKRSAPA